MCEGTQTKFIFSRVPYMHTSYTYGTVRTPVFMTQVTFLEL